MSCRVKLYCLQDEFHHMIIADSSIGVVISPVHAENLVIGEIGKTCVELMLLNQLLKIICTAIYD